MSPKHLVSNIRHQHWCSRRQMIASMLVTDVGDEMCWWQLLNIGDGLAILVTNIHYHLTVTFKNCNHGQLRNIFSESASKAGSYAKTKAKYVVIIK